MLKPQRWLFLLFSFGIACLNGQTSRQTPVFPQNDAAVRTATIEQAQKSIQSEYKLPAQFNKEAKAAYLKQREQIGLDVASTIQNTAVFDDLLFPFVRQTYAKIAAANPGSPTCTVLLVNNPTPNAFSIGDGTLIVHTGLLSDLENEDQLAFVLCHEIAHFYLQHGIRQLARKIEQIYSAEFKKQVETIKKTEFNQSEQWETMLRNMQFQSTYHHRDLERQADSLAYRLYLRTDYDPLQAQRLMQLFETIDEPRDSALKWQESFGCVQYPFKSEWTNKGGESIWGSAIAAQAADRKALADSLRTHPESKNRLLWIQAMAAQLQPTSKTPATGNYASIRFLSALENVNAWYEQKYLGRTIYTALLYQADYPECRYFRDIVALSLHGMYQHSKDHRLNDVLSLPSPYFPEKYNQLLILLNNLRLKDLAGLQDCYFQQPNVPEGEYGLFGAYCWAQDKEDRNQIIAFRKEYLSKYPKGRFAEKLRSDRKQ